MALGVDYDGQDCSLARTLEIVGERWTMLILRDAFLGVRRFSDFGTRLGISRAVLTDRLAALVEAGLLTRVPRGARADYELTRSGLDLWPALYALVQWGEAHTTTPEGPRRVFSHAACGTDLLPSGDCPQCLVRPPVEDLLTRPGPGRSAPPRPDRASQTLAGPHRMLTPVR